VNFEFHLGNPGIPATPAVCLSISKALASNRFHTFSFIPQPWSERLSPLISSYHQLSPKCKKYPHEPWSTSSFVPLRTSRPFPDPNRPLSLTRGKPNLTEVNRTKIKIVLTQSHTFHLVATIHPQLSVVFKAIQRNSSQSKKFPRTPRLLPWSSSGLAFRSSSPASNGSQRHLTAPSRETAWDECGTSHGTGQNPKNINVYSPWDDGTGPEGVGGRDAFHRVPNFYPSAQMSPNVAKPKNFLRKDAGYDAFSRLLTLFDARNEKKIISRSQADRPNYD
jgi:hypothetical protein